MSKPTNLQFQKSFDTVANNFEKIVNEYTVKRRSELLRIDSSGLCLEVGSGGGLVTKSYQGTIVCTDISFGMCKEAKTIHKLVVCCDAEKLPFKESTFDGIISTEMIYYLDNPENFISCSHRILKPQGKFLIVMANSRMMGIDKMRSYLRLIVKKGMYFDDGVTKFLELDELVKLLKKNKFKIYSVERRVIVPFALFDKLNRILERTFFNIFGLFIVVKATAE